MQSLDDAGNVVKPGYRGEHDVNPESKTETYAAARFHIQAHRGLVEDEKVGPDHQGGDQDDLLVVPLGIGAHLLGRIEVELVDQLVPVDLVEVAMDAPEQRQGLRSGQRRPQVRLAGHEGHATVRLDGLAVTVETEDRPAALGRLAQPEEKADRGRLARPIGPEITDDLALGNFEVEVIECHDLAVALCEAFGAYGRVRHLQASSAGLYN